MKKQLITFFSICILLLASCSEDEIADALSGNIPDGLKGQVIDLEFTTADYGPYKMGDIVEFTFSSSGILVINDAVGNTLTLETVVAEGSEFIWEDNDHSKRYAVSLTSDGELNEINLLEQTDNSFLGQFTTPRGEQGESGIIQNLAGMYTITQVNGGTHDRMTLTIEEDGDIDFDTDLFFSTEQYELVTDNRECCGTIVIDITPSPSEPHERIEIPVNSATGIPVAVNYFPDYPNTSNRLQVLF